MTNDWRNAMIEEAAKAIYFRADEIGINREVGQKQAEALARAALAVFEKALGEATVTPIDDAMSHYTDPADPFWQSHPEPQGEPSEAQCRILPLQHRVQNPSHHGSAAQGEPSDAPTVQLAARKGGKSRVLTDQLLSQANEHGIHVEVTYPQSEPSDAQVLAALNAYYADYMIRPNKSLDDVRPPRTVQDMRAALRAAFSLREGGVR